MKKLVEETKKEIVEKMNIFLQKYEMCELNFTQYGNDTYTCNCDIVKEMKTITDYVSEKYYGQEIEFFHSEIEPLLLLPIPTNFGEYEGWALIINEEEYKNNYQLQDEYEED